jgi:hypothetical protein
LKTITAQRVGIRVMHNIAASVRAGGGMPLKRLLCVRFAKDVIGRRTGAGVVGGPTGSSSGRRATSRATHPAQ